MRRHRWEGRLKRGSGPGEGTGMGEGAGKGETEQSRMTCVHESARGKPSLCVLSLKF